MRFSQTIGLGLLGVFLFAFNAGSTFSQESAEATEEISTEVDEATVALQLVEMSRAKKMPEGLVSAALILHRLAAAPTEKPSEGESAPAVVNASALLDEAKAMRADDKALAEIVARAKDELKEKPRGAVTGPKMTSIGVAAGKDASIKVKFAAKKPASVNVCGPGLPVYLKVSVLNAAGKVIAKGEGWNSKGIKINFTPAATEDLTIKIGNASKGSFGGYLAYN